MAKVVDDRTQQLKDAVGILANHVSTLQNLSSATSTTYNFIDPKYSAQFMTDLTTHQQATDLMINYAIAIANVQAWDQAFLSLREGKLPLNLISYDQLKVLLNQVKDKLPPHLQMAFDDNSWYENYNLPLTRFTASRDEIVIRFSVPLVSPSHPQDLKIMIPKSIPVPCDATFCVGPVNSSDVNYIRPLLSDKAWIMDRDLKVNYEADLSHLDCEPLGQEHFCFTFSPTFIHQPSKCVKSIDQENLKDMMIHCRYEITGKTNYRPIKAFEANYVIHNQAVTKYRLIDRSSSKAVVESELNQWATVVQIPKNHILVTTDRDFVIYGPIDIRAPLVTRISRPRFVMFESATNLTNVSMYFDEEAGRDFVPLNLTEFQSKLEFDPKLLAEISVKTNNVIEDLKSSVLSVVHILGPKISFRFDFNSIILILYYTVVLLLTVLFFVVSIRSRNFYLFKALVITELPTTVNGFSINPINYIWTMPDLTIDSIFAPESILVSLSLNMLLMTLSVVVLILLLISVLKYHWFTKIVLTNHQGVFHDSTKATRFFGSFSFIIISNTFRQTTKEHIRIFFPLDFEEEIKSDGRERVTGAEAIVNLLSIVYDEQNQLLRPNNLLHFRFKTEDGRIYFNAKKVGEFYQITNIPIKSIHWNKGGEPSLIRSFTEVSSTVETSGDPRKY